MGKALGITAFVFLMISFPIPVLGNWISVLALLTASVAAFAGERVWSVVVALVGGVKLFFMSPSWIFLMYSARLAEGAEPYGNAVAAQQRSTNTGVWYFTLIIVLAPLAIAAWRTWSVPVDASGPDADA
jgi:hypothetical protein